MMNGALAVSLVLGLLVVPSAAAHHYLPIQPGAQVDGSCTINFIFEDEAGALYAGTAGHCANRGERATAAEIGEYGTVVYDRNDYYNWTQPANQSGPLNDFALIRIDSDKYDQVNPAVRFWGGPTAVADHAQAGSPTLHYAQGSGLQATEPSRFRPGILNEWISSGPFTDWYFASTAVAGGDSGGPILTGDGRALGVISLFGPSFERNAVFGGPTIGLALDLLAASGLRLEIVTAPFQPHESTSGWIDRLTTLAEHCERRPQATPSDPDGCMRPQSYAFHSVSPAKPRADWELQGWNVMANTEEGVCHGFEVLIGRHNMCQEFIIFLEDPDKSLENRTGELTVEVRWQSSENDVSIRVKGPDDRVSTGSPSGANATQVILEQPTPGRYHFAVFAQRYVELSPESLTGWPIRMQATAELRMNGTDQTHVEAPPADDASSSATVPALSLVPLLIVMITVIWLAGPLRSRR